MNISDAGQITRQRKSTSDAVSSCLFMRNFFVNFVVKFLTTSYHIHELELKSGVEPVSKPHPHYLRSNTEPLNVYTSSRANLRPVVSTNTATSVRCPAPVPPSRSSVRSVRQIFTQPTGNRSHGEALVISYTSRRACSRIIERMSGQV